MYKHATDDLELRHYQPFAPLLLLFVVSFVSGNLLQLEEFVLNQNLIFIVC
jgi:hypothetical protein